ncbi:hypothetical protein DFJ74DRAFT_671706 [Hyaloraphidium curvatum]|nr:hypothetical protein DFJ74DRAFT_671706 [Hyaloraphidium curvatum]
MGQLLSSDSRATLLELMLASRSTYAAGLPVLFRVISLEPLAKGSLSKTVVAFSQLFSRSDRTALEQVRRLRLCPLEISLGPAEVEFVWCPAVLSCTNLELLSVDISSCHLFETFWPRVMQLRKLVHLKIYVSSDCCSGLLQDGLPFLEDLGIPQSVRLLTVDHADAAFVRQDLLARTKDTALSSPLLRLIERIAGQLTEWRLDCGVHLPPLRRFPAAAAKLKSIEIGPDLEFKYIDKRLFAANDFRPRRLVFPCGWHASWALDGIEEILTYYADPEQLVVLPASLKKLHLISPGELTDDAPLAAIMAAFAAVPQLKARVSDLEHGDDLTFWLSLPGMVDVQTTEESELGSEEEDENEDDEEGSSGEGSGEDIGSDDDPGSE